MRLTPWSFLGGGGGDESPRWGHSPRMRSGGSGVRALSQILSDESLSYSLKHISTGSTHFTFHGRALISYIYISCFHDDVIKWKHVLRRWLIFAGNSPVNAGNSSVIGEFPSHKPVTRSFDVFFKQTVE